MQLLNILASSQEYPSTSNRNIAAVVESIIMIFLVLVVVTIYDKKANSQERNLW